MTTGRASATAFAPASVGNVAVGFDVLGLSVSALGDRVRAVAAHATRSRDPVDRGGGSGSAADGGAQHGRNGSDRTAA